MIQMNSVQKDSMGNYLTISLNLLHKIAPRNDFANETFNALGRLINRALGRHSTL